jgi:hypothetical protein
MAKKKAKKPERKPPVKIPLSFDDAVRGFLGVDPKQLPQRGEKKAAPRKKK